MAIVTRNQKLYFAAVGVLALWVGIWGFFIPEHVDKAIPWMVPPFHARFIGALYLSATVLMACSLFARHYVEVRSAMVIAASWTGSLFLISLFYLEEFDFSRGPVWFWFGSYILYPIIGFWYVWTQRNEDEKSAGSKLPVWIRIYFLAQGVITIALSLTLLFAPYSMTNIWPWAITRMLAQIYAGPFLALGFGSLISARQQSWLEVRILALASFVLAVFVLIASAIHKALFSAGSPSMWIWFSGFLFIALCTGIMLVRNMNTGASK
jgi:hypothetical protein